jgi:hypothetical protein
VHMAIASDVEGYGVIGVAVVAAAVAIARCGALRNCKQRGLWEPMVYAVERQKAVTWGPAPGFENSKPEPEAVQNGSGRLGFCRPGRLPASGARPSRAQRSAQPFAISLRRFEYASDI